MTNPQEMFALKEASYMALPTDQRAAAIIRLFRQVFGTRAGLEVLNLLLMDLYAFREAPDSDAQALKNYSTRLLKERLGASDQQVITCAIFSTAKGD
jgi:hypothetical protein